ncbi:putative component of the FACT complex, a general chromatin factor that acts to reorganize nucleosomes [Lyophyllum shimeji]|uniref:FACT complex subunit POB3 n=1 Tax=Lyophyllum shimeji TaxID=47721 RepID=A0A9P3UKK8_LYOSH|nr:putative component of the FACT complex, a general chromatin factor that acts to reorganize nucleosomes [Lyophyllum shimeji]
MTTQFDRIYHGYSSELGKFRVAASGMAWKGADSEGVVAIPANHIDWAQWMRVARQFQLRIGLKDDKREHRVEKFDGFAREDHDKLASLLKNHFGKTLETKEVSFKGWNWGTTDFQGNNLAFLVSDKTAFELPLNQVNNSNMAGRTEVTLEFQSLSSLSKTPVKGMGDEMVEIRFHVPGTHAKLKAVGSDEEDNLEEEEEISAAQVFHDTIKDRAMIGQEPGDLILSFEEILVLTPRGRYDMDMYPEFLRLRGKTYDYKIQYSDISRMFLLPKDDQHVLFILDLRSPIGQGQTRYQYLVMQFSREEEITAELNMTEEEIVKYDKLKKNYEDPTFEVVSGVFRALAKRKIIGSGSFQSRDGHPGIKANLKAIQGDLFFLEKYIFFVSKQPSLIEIADVHQVVFSRVGASMGAAAARTFDLKIVTKSGPEHNFTSINKEDHEPVETFLKDKKIRVKNEMVPDADLLLAAAGGDEDEDEDMQSVISSEDGSPRLKPSKGAFDEEDSEEDEDFHASESDSGSPSSDSESDEGAATASDASGDREFLKKKAKGKAKETGDGTKKVAKKKKKAAKADESDAEEDEKPKKKLALKSEAKKKFDDEMEVDEAVKPKLKPKAPLAKAKKTGEESMEVDVEKPRPKPKPLKKSDDIEEPPKKKIKTLDI